MTARAAESRDTAIRRGSKSFSLASRLFDPATRGLVWDLYAWCRHCDDVVDGQASGLGHAALSADERRARLARLRVDTEASFRGSAAAPPFAALARVIEATALPRVLADDHLAGFAMDVEGRHYRTFDETQDYAYHVAGVVGLMMAWVMGVRNRAVLARASDLGLAFQLSNIARDVGDDVRAGRVYLPSDWLEAAGAHLAPGAALGDDDARRVAPVVARVLDQAERYYDSALHGVAVLPGRSAWAVATARFVYRDIGRSVNARGPEAWTSRTTVSTPRKLGWLVAAGAQTAWLKARSRRAGAPPPRAGLFTPATLDLVG